MLRDLPQADLAAVVIAASIGLIEIPTFAASIASNPGEFWLSIVCFAGVATFGAIPGIALAIEIAVIEFLRDGWRPQSRTMGT